MRSTQRVCYFPLYACLSDRTLRLLCPLHQERSQSTVWSTGPVQTCASLGCLSTTYPFLWEFCQITQTTLTLPARIPSTRSTGGITCNAKRASTEGKKAAVWDSIQDDLLHRLGCFLSTTATCSALIAMHRQYPRQYTQF